MTARRVIAGVGAAAVATSMYHVAPTPSAQAEICPDAEVVFARGTDDAAPLGPTGEDFIATLRSHVSLKWVRAYGVDYPASLDFDKAVDGIGDARAHILATAAGCPETKIVLGGYSQGAAVIGFVTASTVPDGVAADEVPTPMPDYIADHVSAVVLFAKPAPRVMRFLGDPTVTVGPRYRPRTLEVCVDNDLICDADGSSFAAHDTYIKSGMTDRGATFAASKLMADWAADAAAEAAAAAAAEPPGPVSRREGTPRLPGPVLLVPPQTESPTVSPTPEPHFRQSSPAYGPML
ncbi:cutinase family protein [Mycolicibacterium sp.]|uniref:cutinase family protein n=1 Tax=Mycolicibacterium sp. TaxID=2320850 RepID=UPI0037C7F871